MRKSHVNGRVVNGGKKKVSPVVRLRFHDEKVIIKKTGAIAYLRGRYDVVKRSVRFSLRNQMRGKGKLIVQINAVPIEKAGTGLDRLHSKVAFDYVVVVPYLEFKKEYKSE